MDRASHAPSLRRRPAGHHLSVHAPSAAFTVRRRTADAKASRRPRRAYTDAAGDTRAPVAPPRRWRPHTYAPQEVCNVHVVGGRMVVRATNARRRRSVWAARCLSRFPWLIDDRRPSAWPQSIWLVIATTTRGRHDARSVLCSCIHDPAKYIP